ncbi:hypothetical protein PG993_004066 [Apiospora rasikravindrae]|uniref:F-box domain-containing protein n=1 Tax=Apiospora rasikravindrae TaxID=990691 RepID=A0ABR1TBQ1_9PEZI
MDVIARTPEGQLVPSKVASNQANSAFMNLPLDVIKTIQDHLPPETAAYLGLTCRAAMNIFEHQRLEKDLSDRFYYCWDCRRHHRYSRDRIVAFDHNRLVLLSCQKRPNSIGAWHFGFHHFQLAMNEHFYGRGRGLPNWILQSGKFGLWSVWPTLAILDDQLFVEARYLLELSGTLQQIRRQLREMGRKRLQFCAHLDSRRLPELRRLREHWPMAPFEAAGNCSTCLTDYVFYLERRHDWKSEMTRRPGWIMPTGGRRPWRRGTSGSSRTISWGRAGDRTSGFGDASPAATTTPPGKGTVTPRASGILTPIIRTAR